jgi:hypothetical protein
MGKRTIRIPRSKIAEQLSQLPGKSVQVWMLDGKTHAGLVQSVATTAISVADANAQWTNHARHLQKLAIADINFILLDVISPW